MTRGQTAARPAGAEIEVFLMADRPAADGRVVMTGVEARHISRVKRHRPGDRVFATDGEGTEYEVELEQVQPARVSGRMLRQSSRPREPRVRLTIAQGIIKGDRMAQMVESVAQLGVERVVPLLTRRVVAGLSAARLVHLRRVSTEAMKSSAGSVLPAVDEPVSLPELVTRFVEFEAVLVANEGETQQSLSRVLPRVSTLLVVVGPEGGFEREEIELLSRSGARCFTMGPRRFRAETASLVAAAMVYSALGELGPKTRPTEGRC